MAEAMVHLNSLLFTVMVGAFLAAATCKSDTRPTIDEAAEEILFLAYRVGGEMDTYREGDRYGTGIDVRFDGSYVLYRRFYREAEAGRSQIQDRKVGEGVLDESTLGTLRKQVEALELPSIPRRLPDVDPRKAELLTPAERVLLRVRPDPSEESTELRANMGADPKHYPAAFLRLHERLKTLVRERISERGD